MKIAVASGKGGTGKTTIATMLAYATGSGQYVDCDAEEPNGHIFLKPAIEKEFDFTMPIPHINTDVCTFCQKCEEACVYKAIVIVPQIKKVMFFDDLCHACGTCSYVCPVEGAIEEIDQPVGRIRIGRAKDLHFLEGRLNIKEASATQLINNLKKHIIKDATVVLDAPPGTSCSVVATLDGVDYVLLVTEPTPFGLSDLKLSVELVESMNLPFSIVVNKDRDDVTIIDEYAKQKGIDIIYRLPFSEEFAKLYSEGILPFDDYRSDFENLLKKIEERI